MPLPTMAAASVRRAVWRGCSRKRHNCREQRSRDEDTLMMIALDAGAEDVSTDGDSFEITTAPEDFLTVSEALEKKGLP